MSIAKRISDVNPEHTQFARVSRRRKGARITDAVKRRAVAALVSGRKTAVELALEIGTYPMYVRRWRHDPRFAVASKITRKRKAARKGARKGARR